MVVLRLRGRRRLPSGAGRTRWRCLPATVAAKRVLDAVIPLPAAGARARGHGRGGRRRRRPPPRHVAVSKRRRRRRARRRREGHWRLAERRGRLLEQAACHPNGTAPQRTAVPYSVRVLRRTHASQSSHRTKKLGGAVLLQFEACVHHNRARTAQSEKCQKQERHLAVGPRSWSLTNVQRAWHGTCLSRKVGTVVTNNVAGDGRQVTGRSVRLLDKSSPTCVSGLFKESTCAQRNGSRVQTNHFAEHTSAQKNGGRLLVVANTCPRSTTTSTNHCRKLSTSRTLPLYY
jgi:hypothetical protein